MSFDECSKKFEALWKQAISQDRKVKPIPPSRLTSYELERLWKAIRPVDEGGWIRRNR